MEKCGLKKDDGKSFRILIFQRKLQEHMHFPEYSGIYMIYSIERSAPGPHMLVDNNAEHVDDDASKSGGE